MSQENKKKDLKKTVSLSNEPCVILDIQHDCVLDSKIFEKCSRKCTNLQSDSYPDLSEDDLSLYSNSDNAKKSSQKRKDKKQKKTSGKKNNNEMESEKKPRQSKLQTLIKKRPNVKAPLSSCLSKSKCKPDPQKQKQTSKHDQLQNPDNTNENIENQILTKADLNENDIFIIQVPKNYDCAKLVGAKLKVNNGSSFKVIDISNTARNPQAASAVVYLKENDLFGVKIKPSCYVNARDQTKITKDEKDAENKQDQEELKNTTSSMISLGSCDSNVSLSKCVDSKINKNSTSPSVKSQQTVSNKSVSYSSISNDLNGREFQMKMKLENSDNDVDVPKTDDDMTITDEDVPKKKSRNEDTTNEL